VTKKLPGWAYSVLCAAGVVLVASMFVNWIDVEKDTATGVSLAWNENKWLFLVPIAGAVLAVAAGARSEATRLAALAAGISITGYTLYYLAKGLAFEGGAQTWLMFGGAGALLAGMTKTGRVWRALGGAAVLAGFFAPWAKMSMWDFMRSGLFDLMVEEAGYIRLLWLIPVAGVIGIASALSSHVKAGRVALLCGIAVFGAFAGVLGLLANEVLAWGAWSAFGASTVALVLGVLAPAAGGAAVAPAAAKPAKA
jgi:hypothetical protein